MPARRHLLGLVLQVGQTLAKIEIDECFSVFKLSFGQRTAFGNIVPVSKASATTACGRVLCIINRVALKRCLTSVAGRFGRGEIFFKAGSCGLGQCDPTLASRMRDGGLVNLLMKEMVANSARA